MSAPLKIVGVSGSLKAPSRTIELVEQIAESLGAQFESETTIIRVNELGPSFAGALERSALPAEVEQALLAIETADVLIVASPVYRASFTGLFKHLFDFVDQYALVDTPILLAATGGSERHALIIEHQFRPLFGFFQALTRKQLPPEAEAELQHIENADLLIVATPVYRASFTGLFKHLFDFVDQYALVDTPVLLAATGGSERHALIIEHQLRPLFGFFQSLALPVGVYAHDSDFTDYKISNEQLDDRIEKAIARALPLVKSSLVEKETIERTLAGEEVSED